jgi:Resolvase, N terminal domain
LFFYVFARRVPRLPARRRRADGDQAGPVGAIDGGVAVHEADLTKRGEKLDTHKPNSKLMLTILAGVATWEREIILERQREGIAKAKAEGKYKRRPVSIDAAQVKQLRATLGPAAIAKHSHCPQFGLPRARIDTCQPPSSLVGVVAGAISTVLRSASHADDAEAGTELAARGRFLMAGGALVPGASRGTEGLASLTHRRAGS